MLLVAQRKRRENGEKNKENTPHAKDKKVKEPFKGVHALSSKAKQSKAKTKAMGTAQE